MRPLVVWQWRDGKRGHERQCEGLVAALAARTAVDHHLLDVPRPGWRRFLAFLRGTLHEAATLPNPDLILGAGRACPWPVLAARRARGGRAVFLMRPQLPLAWFDLCVIPRHDRPPPRPNVIETEGPLNPMHPGALREATLGVVLLGGPSAHHDFDVDGIVRQIEALRARAPDMHWVVTDSRRSPPTLAQRLAALHGLEFHSHRDTPPDWLPALLGRAAQAWISEDSMAMVFEALTAGAAVGLLNVPARRRDRITGIADDLRARGLVMDGTGGPVAAPAGVRAPRLAEATRVADLVFDRWPELLARDD